MMKTFYSRLQHSNNIIVFYTILLSFFLGSQVLALPSQAYAHLPSSQDYVRPAARDLLETIDDCLEHEPQQVHVSMVGEDHMRVSWITMSSHAPSTVEYGKEAGKYTASATGHHLKYEYLSYTSGKIHHTVIGPLEAATTYYYRCSKAGPDFSFRTPPSSLPIEFAVVGDLGQTGWTKSTLHHVSQTDYDVFLLPGDLSYADTDQIRWDIFGHLVQPYASSRPWMTTEGNHEVETIPMLYQEPFKAYNSRWLMPFKESSSTSNLYYSFDVAGGSVHVIMLGSYVDYGIGSDQYKWLQADLARVERTRTPWVFVLLHAPWYNSNAAHKGEGEGMRNAMEELLYKARVDLVFSGHVHAYERFTRVYDNSFDSCGPIYITIGDGGNREGLAISYEDPAPLISMYREPSFGHGRLRVINETKAHWAWHRNNDSYSLVADEIWLDSLRSSTLCMPNLHDNDEL
ncbi:hypothetical protein V2J09_006603 [Rumex salicifolius]